MTNGEGYALSGSVELERSKLRHYKEKAETR